MDAASICKFARFMEPLPKTMQMLYSILIHLCSKMLLFVTLTLLLTLTKAEWELVWSDEFDGDEIDPTKWSHEITQGGGGVIM